MRVVSDVPNGEHLLRIAREHTVGSLISDHGALRLGSIYARERRIFDRNVSEADFSCRHVVLWEAIRQRDALHV